MYDHGTIMKTAALRLRGLLLTGLLSAACGSTITPVINPGEDAGAAEDRWVPTEQDAPTALDNGAAPTDAGSPATDAVTPPVDAPAPIDAPAPVDAPRPVDAPAPIDAPAPVDVPPRVDVPAPMDSGTTGQCFSNSDCGRSEFCSALSCDGPGRCEARPMGCATVYLPVCGCDGRTYGNTCEAAASGARVRDRGACGTTADAGSPVDVPPADTGISVCATVRCTATSACCDVPGAPAHGGCYPRTCTTCCVAPSSDAGLPPGTCRSNSDCLGRNQYCAGSGCDTAGTCQTRPSLCTSLYSPVCGCDGNTYSNSCVAESSGVRVASRGACLSPCALVRCAPGQACCDSPRSPSYGRCYDTRCLACCM